MHDSVELLIFVMVAAFVVYYRPHSAKHGRLGAVLFKDIEASGMTVCVLSTSCTVDLSYVSSA